MFDTLHAVLTYYRHARVHVICHIIAACPVVKHIFLSVYNNQSENVAVAQVSATLALPGQCNFWHSRQAVLRLYMAPKSQ